MSLVPPPLEGIEIRIKHNWANEESVEGNSLHQPPKLFLIYRVIGARLDLVSAIREQSNLDVTVYCERGVNERNLSKMCGAPTMSK